MIAHHTPRGAASHGHTARRCAQLATIIALVASGAASLPAQRIPDINGPKRAAQKAADATNANISAQTGQDLPARRGTAAPASGPGSTGAKQAEATGNVPTTLPPGSMAPVTREVFTYELDSRRDPFFSLILTEDLRPLLSDLKLVGILYEASGRRSVAIMRDILTNAQYRVNAGMSLGRMRVAQIKPRAVIFTVDEFGLSRQDSLVLVDSSKVRIR
ncbi:MAG: hypothetical protein JWL61_733 [Gemmatimonadetes bacterium]|nr:hypothetical protein [Gemmatimonadota bacterium]